EALAARFGVEKKLSGASGVY
ncbi:2,4-dihydroxyhept-2-ene-1,7-dioic acid aldolase, partial [Salmonella enterica subsp. enterica serovar Typhimurium]|nr:2,4-dihydroxyhept-2-ene-1,7-dioic acid aldolase [Salmonella enterica subsp. enterica serovar Typhimurium]EDL1297870.1 2,4-dihydroxyhept-2-ene-1,7-dioic acid aldolase [Salmonella enterica subsp. enterica serovar Typhimurium]